jgi:uridine kinase
MEADMIKEKTPFVIAISAVSGGGKTTITKLLNQKLHNSKILFFDEYNFNGPDDIINWVDNGGDANDWDVSPLIKDLQVLLTESLDYIILDFPFSYKHSQVSKFIDFSIFIDTPLDIALARRVTRDFCNSSTEDILSEMKNYTSRGRRGYLNMLETIKPDADFVIDGTLQAAEVINVILDNLKN